MTELRRGDLVGDYVIDRPIGRGGHATVFAGRSREGAPVAIKVLHAEHVGSTAMARFEREVEVVRKLRHPNIVKMLAASAMPDGQPFCIMERLYGKDLHTVLLGGPLRVEQVIEIVAQIAGALGAAHAAGVIHRDVKASNVFLCDDSNAVLLDFGIAKLVAGSGITMSRESVGTVGSMAPEQLTAKPVDARTDVYALTALLYHLVTGRVPFRDGDSAIEIQLHRFAQRPRASELGAPGALDPVIIRGMAIRPDDRFATTAELADAVRGALGAGSRARIRAVGIQLEAGGALDALHATVAELRAIGFRPIAAGIAGGAWWCPLDVVDRQAAMCRVEMALERGIAASVHVADLELVSGQAIGGPLSELWRWPPYRRAEGPSATPRAAAEGLRGGS
jgi:serine/threonine-protein kinase